MKIIGVDVTSTPSRTKPLGICHARLEGGALRVDQVEAAASFRPLEAALNRGPFIAAMDFPFGLPRVLLQWAGWPLEWQGVVKQLAALTRAEWVALVADFRASQPVGQKHPKRAADSVTGSASPVNVIRPPVGLMLHAVAPLLLASGVSVPPLYKGDTSRHVVEGYPALVAQTLVGTRRYKDPKPHDHDQVTARRADLIAALQDERCTSHYGIAVTMRSTLIERLQKDEKADLLDSVLCAMQAAWTAGHETPLSVMPPALLDPVEGCIADPLVRDAAF